MSNQFAFILLILIGSVLVLAGLAFFLRPRWLLGWLKGMAMMSLLILGGYAIAVGLTLNSYRSLEEMQTVAILAVSQNAPQRWQVSLQIGTDSVVFHEIRGDQWQMDARIIRFGGPLGWMGISPAYRLERLGGRYASIDDERSGPRTVVALSSDDWLDLWALDRKFDLPFVEGVYGNATYMPMSDGARYDIRLSDSGLVAVPVNQTARDAVNQWPQ